jgi:hypothetical protein
MGPEKASEFVCLNVAVTREDIARAKDWILKTDGHSPREMADHWVREHKCEVPKTIDLALAGCEDLLKEAARSFSLRLALFYAVWELVSVAELIPVGGSSGWEGNLEFLDRGHNGGLDLKSIKCVHPENIFRPLTASGVPSDPDVFLTGIDCKNLHDGIREAIEQSLNCFRRGLYMPATAMLAAAAEATWIECGVPVAKKLTLPKLEGVINDPMVSISKKVSELRKTLEHGNAKALLKAAGQSTAKVVDAELWTTVLRERRNALHWGKKKSFVADHAETAALLMGAPLHIGTLEAIRVFC